MVLRWGWELDLRLAVGSEGLVVTESCVIQLVYVGFCKDRNSWTCLCVMGITQRTSPYSKRNWKHRVLFLKPRVAFLFKDANCSQVSLAVDTHVTFGAAMGGKQLQQSFLQRDEQRRVDAAPSIHRSQLNARDELRSGGSPDQINTGENVPAFALRWWEQQLYFPLSPRYRCQHLRFRVITLH